MSVILVSGSQPDVINEAVIAGLKEFKFSNYPGFSASYGSVSLNQTISSNNAASFNAMQQALLMQQKQQKKVSVQSYNGCIHEDNAFYHLELIPLMEQALANHNKYTSLSVVAALLCKAFALEMREDQSLTFKGFIHSNRLYIMVPKKHAGTKMIKKINQCSEIVSIKSEIPVL